MDILNNNTANLISYPLKISYPTSRRSEQDSPEQNGESESPDLQSFSDEMARRAARGIYPGCVPFGYYISTADGSIQVDPLESQIVSLIFELAASEDHTLASIADETKMKFGARVSESNVSAIIHDCFYAGAFAWDDRWYFGTHPLFIGSDLFYAAQLSAGRLHGVPDRPNKCAMDNLPSSSVDSSGVAANSDGVGMIVGLDELTARLVARSSDTERWTIDMVTVDDGGEEESGLYADIILTDTPRSGESNDYRVRFPVMIAGPRCWSSSLVCLHSALADPLPIGNSMIGNAMNPDFVEDAMRFWTSLRITSDDAWCASSIPYARMTAR